MSLCDPIDSPDSTFPFCGVQLKGFDSLFTASKLPRA